MIDKRDKLVEEPFSYRAAKAGKVFLSWEAKRVKVIKGNEAEEFLAAIKTLDKFDAQLLMATMTGNFKRGNERLAKAIQDKKHRSNK